MEKQLLVRLEGLLNHESYGTVDFILANHLLQHYRDLEHTSIAELAAQCSVSPASVSRFARNLGYQDFFDLKDDLSKLVENESNGLEIFRGLNNASSAEFLSQVTAGMQASLEAIPDAQLDGLVRMIFAHERLVLMGHWHSADAALQLQHDLVYLGKTSQIFVHPDEQRLSFKTMQPNTLFIVFSCAGNFFADFFPRRTAPPLAPGSSLCLLTAGMPQKQVPGVALHLDCNAGLGLAGSNLSLFFLEKRILLRCYQYKAHSGELAPQQMLLNLNTKKIDE